MNDIEKSSVLWSEKWPAPAKLNLMLRIVGRREDGYHLLQTVFQFVDWCDWLTFHPLADGQVRLKKVIPGVPEASDLTVRAANLLRAASGCEQGVCIEVEKNLPMGGGLGGGSSDAATTLLVLNQLWGVHFSVEKLMQLGLQLGADVPAFLYGFSSWAEGVGEKLKKIVIPEQWVVIIKPACHVNTREIFLTNDLTRDSKSITMAEFVAGQHQNDCLAVVSKLYQEVAQALTDLSDYAEARLTGTGACVFAEFASKKSAKLAYSALAQRHKVFLVKSLNCSPLLVKLQNF